MRNRLLVDGVPAPEPGQDRRMVEIIEHVDDIGLSHRVAPDLSVLDDLGEDAANADEN